MTFPDAETRLVAVLGHPVDHSLSPAIHNAALRHASVNAVYLAFDVRPEDFESAVDGLRTAGAIGVNVTIPHKRAAFDLAGRRAPEAERTGASNTLLFGSGVVEAHNTDVGGVRRALVHEGLSPAGARCLLLGAGGAARAVAWALAEAGAAGIVVANRTRSRADELAAAVQGESVPWSEVEEAAGAADVIVNATSLGMTGGATPVSPYALQRGAAAGCRGVLDLVYGPHETPLVRAARAAGLPAADGLSVLVYQAAEAFQLFTGAGAAVEVMLQAAARAAGRRVPSRAAAESEDMPPIV